MVSPEFNDPLEEIASGLIAHALKPENREVLLKRCLELREILDPNKNKYGKTKIIKIAAIGIGVKITKTLIAKKIKGKQNSAVGT